MVDLLVPPPEETGPGKLTVGKVYGGMLILENWKLSRFGQGFAILKNIPVRDIDRRKGGGGGYNFKKACKNYIKYLKNKS